MNLVDHAEVALAEALEALAFALVEPLPVDRRPPLENWPAVVAKVVYQGQRSGEIWLAAAPDLLEELSRQVNPEHPTPAGSHQREALLMELLNIAAGHLVVAYYGSQAKIRIGIPQLAEVAPLRRMTEEGTTWLAIEGHPVLMAVAEGTIE